MPAVFPIEEILSDRDLRHVKLLYGIGGLSYGNVSARRLDVEPAWTHVAVAETADAVQELHVAQVAVGEDLLDRERGPQQIERLELFTRCCVI